MNMLKNLFAPDNLLYWLLIFVPIAALLELRHAEKSWIFVASALAIVPLAGLMGKATEHLAAKMGEGIGGLLNATFGNAAELIIALIAMRAGLYSVVKASITGSIIGNTLLVLGLSIVVGGLKFEKQTFNRTAAGLGTTMLTLSGISLVVPAIFNQIKRVGFNPGNRRAIEQELSLEISIVLFITYILSLIFSLKTHKHLYNSIRGEHEEAEVEGSIWSKRKAITALLSATALVALMSEFLVGAIEETAKQFNLSNTFIGVILVAIIGNAAEHSTALIMALKNKMDLTLNIAIGSSLQIALFVAPLLVFVSYLYGKPMDLLFTPFEVLAVVLSVIILHLVSSDGESNWLEGIQLLAVYAILAMAFYFLP